MIAGAFGSFSGAVRACSVTTMPEIVGAERVLEWAGVAETSRSHAEADVLRKDARGNVHGERRHIRIDCHTILTCALDVGGIVEQSLPFESDCA